MLRKFAILWLIALLVGCANSASTLPTYENVPAKEVGYVVGSVGVELVKNARISVAIRPLGSKSTYAELIYLRQNVFGETPTDIQAGNVYATVSTRRLIPGKYEIYGAMVHFGPLGSIYNKDEFSYPFEVEAGKVTYLGEFIARKMRSLDPLGITRKAILEFSVRDKMERDFELLQKRGVFLPTDDPVKAVMSRGESSNSIFVRLNDEP